MKRLHNIKAWLTPYRDIIVFVVVLFAANALWKLTIDGDEHSDPVFFFGHDITAPFEWMVAHVSAVVYEMLAFTRDTVHLRDISVIYFDTGNSIRIVWGCTPIKQSFIWLCIMLFARGSWKHKLWFIPLGWLVCYAFNILRLYLIALVVEHHPEYFELLHTYIFKYLFYGILFLLWVWWVEKLVPRQTKANPVTP